MIPNWIDIKGVWSVLPPGIFDADLSEVEARFVFNKRREELFDGFVNGSAALKLAGCAVLYLDGSFVTDKRTPGDYDVCWDPLNVDDRKLDPVFLDFANFRQKQKDKFGGEYFPSSSLADGKSTFLDFFQIDKFTGQQKGIVKITL